MTRPPRQLLKLNEVMSRLSVCRSKLYKMRRDDENFPKPVNLGRVLVWDAHEIDTYVDGLFEARDAA